MKPIERQREVARETRTLTDRVIGYFSPERGVERMKARMRLASATGEGGYAGGRRDRRSMRNWRPAESSADADILPDLPDLRARTRDLSRNMPIATGAVKTDVTNVIGDGLKLQASVDHEALGLSEAEADRIERDAEREWELFCKSADFSRVQHVNELAALAYRAERESGDVFGVRRFRKDRGDVYGTKIQLIEADRVSNPNRAADSETIAGGVEIDKDGVPVAYHFTDKHPGALRVGSLKWERIAARTADGRATVLHLFERSRPEQTRGVPFLAPVVEALKQLGDYSEAEISAAVVSAFYTVFLTSDSEQSNEELLGDSDREGLADNEVKLGKGAVVRLGTDEKAEIANPGRPNVNFDPFFMAICRQIGVALEIPVELLIKHFTASYSASRAALEMAWQSFRRRRGWFASRFYQQLYEWMWEEAVASGRLNAPGFFEDERIRQAYVWAEWIGPSRPSINPKAEAEADKIDLELGTKTREQICIERTGGEAEDKIRQLAKEKRLLDAAGLSAPERQPASRQPEPSPDAKDDSDDEDDNDNERKRA